MKLLLYCTKAKPYLVYGYVNKFTMEEAFDITYSEQVKKHLECYNGKILAECDFEIEKIRADYGSNHIGNIEIDDRYDYYVNSLRDEYELCKKSCLTMEELDDYLKGHNGYAIHIKNLNIFDKPRELRQYHRPYGCINISCERKTKQKYLGCSLVRHCKITQIKKAPQNMMKVESKICDEKDYILISIRPEWVFLELNGTKTIEIRKRVLKEMVK